MTNYDSMIQELAEQEPRYGFASIDYLPELDHADIALVIHEDCDVLDECADVLIPQNFEDYYALLAIDPIEARRLLCAKFEAIIERNVRAKVLRDVERQL